MIHLHGPIFQWECDVCGEMSDCFDTIEERNLEALKHGCSLDIPNNAPVGTTMTLPGGQVWEKKRRAWVKR